MNKIILMGRLTRDPEIRFSQGEESLLIARYTLAVPKRFKQKGEEVDFINCVAFGKAAEFAQNYILKGQRIAVVGRLQVRSWEDSGGQKRWSTEVVIEEQYFASDKFESVTSDNDRKNNNWQVELVEEDEDLPF